MKNVFAACAAVIILSSASCHQRQATSFVGTEPVIPVPVDSCSMALLDFFRDNAVEIRAVTYERLPVAVAFPPEAADALISLDKVNSIVPGSGRDGRIVRLKDSSYSFSYLGSIDVSDSLECYAYSVKHASGGQMSESTYALVVRGGSVKVNLMLQNDGKESGFVTGSLRESRNVFLISTFSVDMIDSDGKPKGGRDRVTVNDDGSVVKVSA